MLRVSLCNWADSVDRKLDFIQLIFVHLAILPFIIYHESEKEKKTLDFMIIYDFITYLLVDHSADKNT